MKFQIDVEKMSSLLVRSQGKEEMSTEFSIHFLLKRCMLNKKRPFEISILLSLVVLLIFSCSQKKQPNSTAYKTGKKIIEPQLTIIADLPDSNKPRLTVLADLPDSNKPKTIYLANSPKPKTTIATKPTAIHSFIDPNTHAPVPPESQGIGFTNFTTDHGLALDHIRFGISDQKGNLWFGTQGGGVSCYDGKAFVNYTAANGLGSNAIASIGVDRHGDLWFGTEGGGVSRYDGKTFRKYGAAQGLAGSLVIDIVEDRTGILWLATDQGVSRYDGNRFTSLDTADGLANNFVTSICEDKLGNLWFGTGQGISRYDGNRFTSLDRADGLANNFVTGICEDKLGNLWFGTWGGGVSCWNGVKFTNYTIKEGLANDSIYYVGKDDKGNPWFGTFGSGVSRYDGNGFTSFSTVNGLAKNHVMCISKDKLGNLWFGTWGGGVSRYNGGSYLKYTTSQGLGSDLVYSINEDSKGNLWFGTPDVGVSRYDGQSLTTYSTAQGLASNSVYCITEDKRGNLWFGTFLGGVSRFDGNNFTNFTTKQGLLSNSIFHIVEDNTGNLWFGTFEGGGVSRYDGTSFTNFTTKQGLAGSGVFHIAEDNVGNLWFGTLGDGVSCYNGTSFTNYTTAQGLGNNSVQCIKKDDKGNLWIGTGGGGVSRWDGKSFLNFTTGQGLPDNMIWAIERDSLSNMIFGTNYGIAILVAFSSDSLAETNGNLVPSQNNLSNEELRKYRPQFEIYNSSTGYPIKDLNARAMKVDHKGVTWMGTGGSQLMRFNYPAINKSVKAPQVVLQNIKLDNEKICWYNLLPDSIRKHWEFDTTATAPNITEEAFTLGFVLNDAERDSMRLKFKGIEFDSIRAFYRIPENLVLPHQHNSISFEFAAIEPSRHQPINYQYFLEGFDREWSSVSNQTSATYGNVFEGTYKFKVKAQWSNGKWSEPTVYSFRVLPPWWRTRLSYAAYILVFILALWRIIRWRVSTLKKEKIRLEEEVNKRTKELEQSLGERHLLMRKVESQEALLKERLRISRELHDDIGSTLGSISIYSEVAKKRTEKKENTSEVLSKIGHASRELIDKMSDIVWSLNPNNESFEQLQNRMMAFAAMILAPQNIHYDFIADGELNKIQFTGEQRKNIFLIFKEALHNMVKYACCSNSSITLSVKNNSFKMTIKDDGKGFDVSQIDANATTNGDESLGGNGIKNMHARADDMSAKLSIHSKVNEGTTIQLTMYL